MSYYFHIYREHDNGINNIINKNVDIKILSMTLNRFIDSLYYWLVKH